MYAKFIPEQSKLMQNLLLVKIKSNVFLGLFIVVSGVRIENPHPVMLTIFLTIMDDASRAIWVYLMCEKGEASKLIRNFVIMACTQFGKKG